MIWELMKLARLGGIVLGVVLGGIAGILLTTNPNRQDYEQYASQRFLRGYCKMLVDTGHPFLQEAIATHTTRKNFVIFSVYQTELWFPPPLPSYHFSTVGFLNKLYIYEALEL